MKIALVTPVYDDWQSLNRLLLAIDEQDLGRIQFDVFVVNDGSPKAPNFEFEEGRFRHIRSVRLVNLLCNLGHQRAIAVGLAQAFEERGIEGVLVMDSDGEDRPEEISRLIATGLGNPGHVVVARRTKRSETLLFKSLYFVYKRVFRWLSGVSIDFGNFCFIPQSELRGLLQSPPLWNHLAATLIRSRLPLIRVPTERGKRYFGRSRMNLDTLIVHGLSAISVYSDIVVVRIMMAMLGIAGITLIGFGVSLALKFFTESSIPGWTTSVFGILGSVLLQSLIFSAISAFMLLNSRSTKPIIPMIDAPQFVASITRLDVAKRPADSGQARKAAAQA